MVLSDFSRALTYLKDPFFLFGNVLESSMPYGITHFWTLSRKVRQCRSVDVLARWQGLMDELIIVIIVLGLLLVLLLRIGDLVGTAAFGLVIIVLGWAYRVTERPKEEKQEE
jgi:hypothetical protein